MQGQDGVATVVLSAKKGAKTNVFDIRFRLFEFGIYLLKKAFVVFLDSKVNDLFRVGNGFFRVVVNAEFVADRLRLAADMRGLLHVRPHFRLFEFRFQFL